MSRESVVVGRYYPGSVEELAARMRELMGADSLKNEGMEDAYGVVVPHASLDCCGSVSAALWRQVKVPDRVIILGPNHTGLGARAAVACRGPFITPGCETALDTEMGLAIAAACANVEFDDLAHEEEHSIEVILPFLLSRNPGVKITAICLRTMSYQDCEDIATAIVSAIESAGCPVMVIASSDLNHGEPLNVSARKDRMALDRIEDLDPRGLYGAVVEHHISMCGMIPTVIMLLATRALGAGFAETVGYNTSVDFTGDPSSVVGYGSVIVRSRCPLERIKRLVPC
jgi:AmmeMemoRadiSam system protein B